MKNTISALFAARLQSLRKSHQLSLSEFSRKIAVSKSMVSNFENEITLPSAEVLLKIANYFCVSTDYLLGRSDDPEYEKYLASANEVFTSDPATTAELVEQYQINKKSHPVEQAAMFLRIAEHNRDYPDKKK